MIHTFGEFGVSGHFLGSVAFSGATALELSSFAKN